MENLGLSLNSQLKFVDLSSGIKIAFMLLVTTKDYLK